MANKLDSPDIDKLNRIRMLIKKGVPLESLPFIDVDNINGKFFIK